MPDPGSAASGPVGKSREPLAFLHAFGPNPPQRVALNPVIFADQFQTGDLSRWSNY